MILILSVMTLVVVATPDLQKQIHDLQMQLDSMHRKLQEGGMAGSMGGDGSRDHGDGSMDHGDGSMHHGDGSMDHGGMDHGDTSHHATSTAGHGLFFTTGKVTTVLFEGWQTSNYGEYIGTCLFVILLGILIEWLSMVRECYSHKKMSDFASMNSPAAAGSTSNAQLGQHLVKTMLYMSSITLAYSLMLIVMTYNVGLFISAVLGLTIGYLTFGKRREQCGSTNSTECCQI